MISPPPSPTCTSSYSTTGKPNAKNDNPALSPKRSFAQLEEDQPSQPELKRRDLQSARRPPLDPLSASDLKNRRPRVSQLTDVDSHHTLVTPSSVPDLRVSRPEQPVSSGFRGMQRSGNSDALVCSWPPPIPTPGTARSSHSGLAGRKTSQCGPVHSPDNKVPSRAVFLESISTAWDAPDSSQTESTATMTKPSRPSAWRSENVLQPIRSRSHSMPSVRRPPRELWRPEPGPTKADRNPVDDVDLFLYPTPPGLPPPRPELRRSDSNPDLLSHGSISLSLAHGSQPLSASEHSKAVPPIGAERSWAVSITSPKSHTRNFPAPQSHDGLWCSLMLSPTTQPRWKNGTNLVGATEDVQSTASGANMSKEDLERLLRHAARNKHAPKVISPLNPLRTSHPAIDLSTDPIYQSRMPSQFNSPSPRYSECPPRRARTICDRYRSLDLNTTCVHCQECKRDTIRKRLLSFRYCERQQTHYFQRNRLLTVPCRAATTPVVDDDRMVLANRIREMFAYDMDEEEKSLWEEVAAVTGAGPSSFHRVSVPCAVTAYRRIADDGNDDGAYDGYLEIADEGLLATESATLFREVSVC